MPSFSFEVEYAKSNRAACKKCKGKIDKGLVRLGFKAEAAEGAEGQAAHMGCSWHHFACFPQAKGAAWFKKHLTADVEIAGIDALEADHQEAVRELLKACRGEVPVPPAPEGSAAEAEVSPTPAKGSKKRKSADDEDTPAKTAKTEATQTLTEEQVKAIDEVKAKLASKNGAFLGAELMRNGLPKSGRKDDLLDRVAENQVLGVPPACELCEKKKLLWSRATGKYSCPGFFDEDAKVFKKCKGPASGAEIVRTPWQEMGA